MRFYTSLLFLCFAMLCGTFSAMGQGKATVYGKVTGLGNEALEGVSIGAPDEVGVFTSTDNDGNYELRIPANKRVRIIYAYVSYVNDTVMVKLADGERKQINTPLKLKTNIIGDGIVVEEERTRHTTIVTIDPKHGSVLPTPSPDIGQILKTLSGVSSNNELSSQYNVRGGNYDENLVYVNDIQIYRPFLVRSGQQEGLSFPNLDLIKNIKFSAGGFEAKYGDKMSSVLDITYKTPEKFAGTATASLLGGALHFEGVSKNLRFNYLFGARHRTNKYVLGSLDTKGSYFPNFSDAQTMVNYHVGPDLEITGLAHYSRNKYTFIPEDRLTQFGTINSALQLRVYFDGQEVNSFETVLGALSATYRPTDELKLKFITSAFNSFESETFDVEGAYFLQELENNFGSENLGEAKANIGVGGYLNHARNYLDATVMNAEHKGTYTVEGRGMAWGVKYQQELINDELSEWNMIDSAGYSIPQAPGDQILLRDVVKTNIKLNSSRYSGYFQHGWFFDGDSTEHALTAGIRLNYWDLNQELIVSPRVTYSIKPSHWKRDWLFRLSGGAYHQPPFYRELRDLNGVINRNIKAQKSYHVVMGADYNFKAWGRDFKYIGELYYKHLEDLIPYEIDNVRIRYYADNIAHGYAAGIDMKVSGEFVKDVESWFSLSIMQTREDIENDFYYEYYNSDGEQIIPNYTLNNVATDSIRFEPGYIPRPTDQRVNVGIFFQDYVPKVPALKMHLNLLFGTGMPFGPPSFERYKDTLRIPPYRRVDIGFSYELLSEKAKKKMGEKNPVRHLQSAWLSLEVFNLLQVSNTISYLWVTDVNNRQYAVPNFLTARQLNLKLIVKF